LFFIIVEIVKERMVKLKYREAMLNEKSTNRKDFRFIFEGWLKRCKIVNRDPTSDCWWEEENSGTIDIHHGRVYALLKEIKPYVGKPYLGDNYTHCYKQKWEKNLK